MHSSLARSASLAVTFILTGAFLVGCGGAGSVPGAPSRASQTSLGHVVDLGSLAQSAGPIGNETMTGHIGSIVCDSFNVRGTAQGPYPGRFQASGKWSYGYSPPDGPTHLKSFSESFTITSHAGTITGSFIWGGGSVIASCGEYGNQPFIFESSDFTYTATLMHNGHVIKQFAGSASESGISCCPNWKFGETLN
jgi:hypothetical protein